MNSCAACRSESLRQVISRHIDQHEVTKIVDANPRACATCMRKGQRAARHDARKNILWWSLCRWGLTSLPAPAAFKRCWRYEGSSATNSNFLKMVFQIDGSCAQRHEAACATLVSFEMVCLPDGTEVFAFFARTKFLRKNDSQHNARARLNGNLVAICSSTTQLNFLPPLGVI